LIESKEDLPYLYEITSGFNTRLLIAENFSVEMTVIIFELSDLEISTNSMAIYLASAFKTPVGAIFSPSNESDWPP
jgi:ADP-heptose:LPS heptosyltransferase